MFQIGDFSARTAWINAQGELMLTFVLFDIDGTLVSLDGAGSRSLNRAMEELLQVTDGFRDIDFAGKTDLQIRSLPGSSSS